MKIVDERKQNTILFKEVQDGQVFYIENEVDYGDNPYMKIFGVEDSDYCELNAVDLQDGQVVRIEDNEPIILCSATLKIY